MARKWVFESLVENKNDGVGLIAYALYKFKKYSLAKSLREEGKSEEYIKEQVKTFHDHTLQSDTLDDYRDQAESYLHFIFLEIEEDLQEDFEKERQRLKKEYEKQLKKEKTAFVKKVQAFDNSNRSMSEKITKWLFSGIPGIVSSFILTAFFLGASLLLVPETKRKEVFSELAIEYLGLENNVELRTQSDNASPITAKQ